VAYKIPFTSDYNLEKASSTGFIMPDPLMAMLTSGVFIKALLKSVQSVDNDSSLILN